MKKQDFLFIILVVVVFLPFFLSDAVYDWYKSFNAEHGIDTHTKYAPYHHARNNTKAFPVVYSRTYS